MSQVQYSDKTEKFFFWNKFPWLSCDEAACFYREMRRHFQRATLEFVNDHIELFKMSVENFLGNYEDRRVVRLHSHALNPGNIAYYLSELVIHVYFTFGALPDEEIVSVMKPMITGVDEAVLLASTIFPRYYSRCIGINNNWCLYKANLGVFPEEDHRHLLDKAVENVGVFTRQILENEWLRQRA